MCIILERKFSSRNSLHIREKRNKLLKTLIMTHRFMRKHGIVDKRGYTCEMVRKMT